MKVMKMKTQRSLSYDQFQLKELSDIVCEDIERLLDILHINDYRISNNMVITSCPIHGGDNNSAFNLYHDGDTYRGNWKCRTHQCENIFKSSIIGFIRGCISRNKYDWNKPGDKMASFAEALDFAKNFSKNNLTLQPLTKREKEKNEFVNTINYITNNKKSSLNRVNRSLVIKTLQIPSNYFLSRNFSKEILTKYDVGECLSPNKEMSGRAVVPIYDTDRSYMIGCTGRSTTNELPKWKHSKGFSSGETLYNFWYAKDFIRQSGIVILVESPGNVWRLEEAGIHNSLAIFGSSLSDKQKMLLDTSGAMTIITIMDNDEAGKKAAEQIMNKCQRTYNIKNIVIDNHSDIADMTINEINCIIKPQLEKIIC